MFLENEEVLFEGYTEEVEVEERQFCEGVDGLLEIALESEMSWNNIMMTAIKEEFIAIRNESSVLLEEAKENLFQRILKWVKEKAAQVASFFKNVTARLIANFTNVKKFVEKHGETIDKFQGTVSVNVHEWKTQDIISGVNALISKLMSRTGTEMNEEELVKTMGASSKKTMSNDITAKFRNDKKVTKDVSASDVKAAKNGLLAFKKEIDALKKNESLNKIQLSSAEKKAKVGLQYAEKKSSEAEKISKQLQTIKAINAVTDRVTAIGISLAQQKLTDDIIVCRAAVSASKPKKEKKEKETKSTNESVSLFGLI